MTTLITHPLPVLAVGLAWQPGDPATPAAAGMLAACLPDFDVVAFKLGIAYHDAFGHRGFSHSLLFAAILGARLACRPLRGGPLKAGLWVALATASHSLLDAMTNGGLGVAWFWPWATPATSCPSIRSLCRRSVSQRTRIAGAAIGGALGLAACLLLALAGMALRFLLRRSR